MRNTLFALLIGFISMNSTFAAESCKMRLEDHTYVRDFSMNAKDLANPDSFKKILFEEKEYVFAPNTIATTYKTTIDDPCKPNRPESQCIVQNENNDFHYELILLQDISFEYPDWFDPEGPRVQFTDQDIRVQFQSSFSLVDANHKVVTWNGAPIQFHEVNRGSKTDLEKIQSHLQELKDQFVQNLPNCTDL